MVKILMLTSLLFACLFIRGQDFTNKGREFWLGFGNHQQMYTSSLPGMDIYITSDVDTRVAVDIPAMGISIGTYDVRAGQITVLDNISQQAFLIDEGVSRKGIHIVAEAPVVVYTQIYNASVTGATLCLPVSTLGKEYYSVNFTQVAQRGPTNDHSHSYFFVVAMEDNTRVQVLPSANSLSGNYRGGQSYELNLNRGEVFNFLSRTDLTGSIVRALDNGTGCKKIAMFCGSGRIGIGCGSDPPSSDNLLQQMYPVSTWGKKYLTVPSATRPLNYYRIIRPDPGTKVSVDGQQIASSLFTGNFYYQFNDNRPHLIEGDRPILVAQYYTTQNCGEETFNGDPEMIFLNPVEQTVRQVTLTSMKLINGVNPAHFINAIVRNSAAAIGSFLIDGQAFVSSFKAHPSDPAYAYAQIPVNVGTHTISCEADFNAIAYGFSQNESYGYSAGANLSDLYQYVTVENDHASVNFPAGCRNSPFRLAMTFPFRPSKIQWIFGAGLNAQGIRDTLINNPLPDSVWQEDGAVTLYRYRLKRTSRISRAGSWPIRVIVVNPGSDRCSGEQEISYDFQVFEKPKSLFSVTHNGCFTDPVQFKDQSVDQGRPITGWYWNFGNGQSVTGVKEHSFIYPDPGSFTIRHATITDLGCTSDTSRQTIRIAPLPVAGFELRSPSCVGQNLRLASTSLSAGDPLTRWDWDFGDGQTLQASNGNLLVHQYETTGPRNVSLQVSTAKGCQSERVTQTITIQPVPAVKFGVPRICIDDPYAQFSDSSSIADGSEGAFGWSWRFGDNNTGADKNPQHRYALPGTYKVSLTVTSGSGCQATAVKPITVNGRVQAAAFAPLPGQPFCANQELQIGDASRIQSGNPLKVVIWWDYDRDPTIKTIDDTPAIGKQYAHKYDDFGTPATRNHRILYEMSTGENCLASSTQVVSLKASPVIGFSPMPPVCEEAPPLALPARELLGAPGTGIFSGPGVTASGSFDPKTAGPGTHTIRYDYSGANGCHASAVQLITVYATPIALAGPDKGILPDGQTILEGNGMAGVNGNASGLSYSWAPREFINDPLRARPSVFPKVDTRYSLTVTSIEGCKATDEVLVKVLPKIVVPNAFTPNGDGINDTWVLLYLESYPNCIVDVFNRYGQRVFHSTGYGRAWDGRMNGSLLPAGTYYWVLDPKNGKGILKGSVTLIR